jgi:hypothetical protein
MGIDWVNIGTGTDYSGTVPAPVSREPRYFADIHLLFPLAQPDMAQVEAAAKQRDIVRVRNLLKAALTGAAKNAVNERIIDSLELRPPDFR